MCDIWRAPGATSIDPARVGREAESWRAGGVERVVLSGGEPLMHRDIWGLVAPLVEYGMGVTLVTTGLLLERHAAQVARFVDDVVVSLDGPEEVHDQIRGVPGAYRKLGAGLAAVRRSGQPRSLRMTARCTVQRANCAAIPETVLAARDLGLDGISFLAVDTTSEAFYRPGGWDEARQDDVAPGRRELSAFETRLAEVEALRGRLPDGFIAESPAKLARLADHFRAYLGEADFPEARCNAPWVSAVVEPDGTVRPCFFHRPIGRWDGSEGGGTLLDVVNSPGAIAFREALDVANDPVCRRCTCRLNLEVQGSPGADAG
jgi:MoaA/NifB/PqqE/SkfB family radical SAM enzyme